jgi:hypothetical protein
MRIRHCFLLPALFLTACGGDGKGTVVVTAYGESFIEDGIPADDVVDGWAVDYSRFEVAISDVTVAAVAISVPSTIDLSVSSDGKGHELGSAPVAEGEHTGSRFTIAKVVIDGTATKDDKTKTFSWVFDRPTRYTECATTTSVGDGGSATFQITVHADHLLYDSLVSEEPQILFQALADADADGDGAITQAELAETDIGAYDPGSEGGIDDLWAWLTAQTKTLGHVDGEGHCHATAVD